MVSWAAEHKKRDLLSVFVECFKGRGRRGGFQSLLLLGCGVHNCDQVLVTVRHCGTAAGGLLGLT